MKIVIDVLSILKSGLLVRADEQSQSSMKEEPSRALRQPHQGTREKHRRQKQMTNLAESTGKANHAYKLD
jgi:hypothetical protein